MRVLVTGGAGFIGSHLVDHLVARGDEVWVVDDFNDYYQPEIKRGNLAASADHIRLIEGDISREADVERVFAEADGFDQIVHLAARAGVRPSINSPKLYLDVNVGGTFHLLEGARRHRVPKFILASSSSVYGITRTVPFSEDVSISQTISPYAATKIACEQLCSTYSHLHGIEVACLRFFTVYGPRQRPDLAIHKFTRRILDGEPIERYGDGTTRRDYTYVDDIIQGVLAAMDHAGKPFDIFNLGENETTQLRDLIALIERALGKKARIHALPEQPGDVPLTCADISKARRVLGYNPQTPIAVGIPKFVDWFLDHIEAPRRQPA